MSQLSFSKADPIRSAKTVAIAILMIPIISGCSQCASNLTSFCAPYGSLKSECRQARLARADAKDVWDCKFATCYANHCDPEGLRKGFIDGFVDACMGVDTDCPPMFAPDQNGLFCHGNRTCSVAWHNGYPLGAAEAVSSGCCTQYCSRVHPCLKDIKLPVNPGCVRIEDYQQNAYTDSYDGGTYHFDSPQVDSPEAIITPMQIEPVELPAAPINDVDSGSSKAQLDIPSGTVPPAPAPAAETSQISTPDPSSLLQSLINHQATTIATVAMDFAEDSQSEIAQISVPARAAGHDTELTEAVIPLRGRDTFGEWRAAEASPVN